MTVPAEVVTGLRGSGCRSLPGGGGGGRGLEAAAHAQEKACNYGQGRVIG